MGNPESRALGDGPPHSVGAAESAAAAAMWELVATLYPICRSITGDGVRETLRLVQRLIPLEIHEVATGTPVLDWMVPREWNIRDAYIATPDGRRVVDFRASSLHVMSYSVPVRQRMRLAELEPHLFSMPDHPDWIPYRTSYYKETWGFCLADRVRRELRRDVEYEVCIDSTLADGALTYGEYLVPGGSNDEVIFSCHCCHPSLANDNLSGIAVATYLALALAARSLRYSYRFLFVPGTIGPITWLARNEEAAMHIRHGLVLACVGDSGPTTYKRTRIGNAEIDRAVEHVLRHSGAPYSVVDFTPYGYDERQYCSPGFNLPVGSLARTPHGRFPEYHTSADNLDLVQPEFLQDTLSKLLAIVDVLERNATYVNTSPKGEPQLGRRGLYRTLGGITDATEMEQALLWVLNQSDGSHTLLDVAERAGMSFGAIARAADALLAADLLRTDAGTGSSPDALRQ
jgi:aminopeptidase-like protein